MPERDAGARQADGPLNIYPAPFPLVVMVVCSVGFLALGAFLAFTQSPGFARVDGCIVAAASVLVFWYYFRQFFRLRDPVVQLGVDSVTDVRQSPQPIPWAAIEEIRLMRTPLAYLGVELVLTRDFEQTFRRAGLQRLLRRFNKALFDYRSVPVGAWGTAIDGATLYQWCLERWSAAKPRN